MVSHLPHFHPSPWEVVSSQPPLYPSTPQPLPLWLYGPAKAGDTVVAISTTTSAAATKTLAMRLKILHLLSFSQRAGQGTSLLRSYISSLALALAMDFLRVKCAVGLKLRKSGEGGCGGNAD